MAGSAGNSNDGITGFDPDGSEHAQTERWKTTFSEQNGATRDIHVIALTALTLKSDH